MTTKTWRRLSIVATVFNVAGAAFAIARGEGWHAGVHISLALGFGFAAQRLAHVERHAAPDSVQQQLDEQTAALEDTKQRLAELEERMDFAERMLAQARDRQKLGS